MRIGLISDTHGLLRPQAVEALRGVVHVLHAGDVGKPGVLEGLAALAPLTAVRGNVDGAEWADGLPETAEVTLDGLRCLVLHDLKTLGAPPPGVAVVVSGHSHKARVEERDGVLYVNPGSAGPRRFRLPITLAILETDPTVSVSVIELEP